MPDTIDIETVESVTAVDPLEWNGLAPRGLFASHGWLRTLEETYLDAVGYRYVLARRSGELLAALACQRYEPGPADQFLFGPATPLARGLRLAGGPTLVCGTRIGTAEPVLLKPSLSPAFRAASLEALLRALEEEARRTGSMVLVRHVSPGSATADSLRRWGFLRTREMPIAYLDLPWKSFAEFRRHLGREHPSTEKSMRWEINRGRRAGFVIEGLDDPRPWQETLHRLLDAHYRRLNGIAFPFRPTFLARLKAHLGERAVVTVARHQDDILGVTVGLRDGQIMSVPMIGVDPERGRHGALYFNLGINWPIERAIAAGGRRLYLGKMLYDLKIRRGCRLVRTDVYVRGRSRLHQAMLSPLVALRSATLDRRAVIVGRRTRGRGGDTASPTLAGRRVLVTSATTDAGLAAMRALTRAGAQVYAADSGRLPRGARSRFALVSFELPPGTHPDFEAALLRLVQDVRPDAFLPLGNRAVLAASHLQDHLARSTALNVPDVAAFMAAYDKAACLESCRALGIACPAAYSMDEALDALGRGDGTTVVVKPPHDEGAARGIAYVRGPDALVRAWTACRERFGGALLQEHIPGGPEAMKTAVLLFSRGSRLAAAFTARKIRQWPPSGGLTAMGLSTEEHELVEQTLPFFEKWGWRGPAEVELKLDERDGRHKLIEINPRFPAYLRFPVRCGLDLPTLAVRLALDESVEPRPLLGGYAVGATHLDPGVFLRSVAADLQHPAIRPAGQAIAALARGVPAIVDALSDPLPLVGRILARAQRRAD
jgi:predicted ATP-grasp superfamily ATP-dependent carboligase